MRTARRMLLVATVATGLVAVPVGVASAHVHGITPLLACGNTAINGANRTDSTPAAAANGGPITGLIPRDVGNAPLTVGDGGFGAAAVDNCQS
ncbi:MAG TPA: hypothetical protein VMR89_01585 [Actinomycetota bacterium]|nr:hypothetical protein [Actinomycetota bacterium]